MNPEYVAVVEAWESALARGEELVVDCLPHLQHYLRVDTIQPIYDRLGDESRKWFLSVGRSYLQTFECLVENAASHGDNPETYFVIREWVYRQPFNWRPVALEMMAAHTDRNTRSASRLFEEIVPLLDRHPISTIVAELRPGWRNQLREFGRGLRPGIDTIRDVARIQREVDPSLIDAVVQWAESTKLERTRWDPGE